MRVEAVETTAIAIPFREPYVTSRGRLVARETVLLRLRTDGAEGTGEGVPLTLRGEAARPAVERDLRGPCAAAIGAADLFALGGPDRDAARAVIWSVVRDCRARGVGSPALAAVDIALHDLAARSMGIPLARLLGAERLVPVKCNATLPAGTAAAVAALAGRWLRRGFSSYKLKGGSGMEIETLKAVRAVVGPRARIRVDINGAWGVEQATSMLSQMQAHGLELVEQPVASVEEMAMLRTRTHVPIAADESVNDAAQARIAVELRACDLATAKLSKVGGISATLELAGMLPLYMSSALDGPIGVAAAAHVAAVLPGGGPWAGIAHGLATLELFEPVLAVAGPRLTGSAMELPESPGHGVELDWDAVARLRA